MIIDAQLNLFSYYAAVVTFKIFPNGMNRIRLDILSNNDSNIPRRVS